MLFDDTVYAYLQSRKAANVRKPTLQTYETALKSLGSFLSSADITDVDDLTPEHIRDWIVQILSNGVLGSSVKTYRTIILCWLNWCKIEGYCDDLKWSGKIPKVKVDKKEPRCLTSDESVLLLQTVDRSVFRGDLSHRRNVAIVRLLLDTGLRETELVTMKMDQLDLVNKCVEVSASSKGRRARSVPFGSETLRAVRHYLRLRKEIKTAMAGDWVWLSRDHHRLSAIQLYRVVTKLAKEAGLKDVTVHTLRHTAITLMLHNGMPITMVQKIAGHSDIRMTMRYAHTLKQDIFDKYVKACPVDCLKAAG